MAHANARLNVHGRRLLVARVRRARAAGRPRRQGAGVSRQCAHRWVARFRRRRRGRPADRSSRPHRCPTTHPAEVEQRVLAAARARAATRSGLDRTRARRPAGTVSRDPAPPPGALPARVRPADRRGDPGLEDHRGPLRTRPHPASWSTWTSRRSAGSPTAAAGVPTAAAKRPASARRHRLRLRPLRSSTTTPGWPTPRSCPTRRAPTCAGFLLRAADYFASHGITRIERVITDNPWSYTRSPRLRRPPSTSSAPRTCSSSRTAPGRTARSSASTAPCRSSGPTGRSSPATTNAPPPLHPGSSTTTLNDATPHSEDSHRSADCTWLGAQQRMACRKNRHLGTQEHALRHTRTTPRHARTHTSAGWRAAACRARVSTAVQSPRRQRRRPGPWG